MFVDDRTVECESNEELDFDASLAKGLTTVHRLKLEFEWAQLDSKSEPNLPVLTPDLCHSLCLLGFSITEPRSTHVAALLKCFALKVYIY